MTESSSTVDVQSLIKSFAALQSTLPGRIDFNVPLAKTTYYQIGGPAAVLATPRSLEDLAAIHRTIQESHARFFILGWGSNLLFPDEGFSGVVIRMKQLFNEIQEMEPGLLKVGASVGGSTLLRQAQLKGWGKLSHLTGIPGSIGGMAVMNAGTHLGEFKDSCTQITTVELSEMGELSVKQHQTTEADFSYRHNHFLSPRDLVIHAWLRYTPEDPAKVRAEIDELYLRRKQTQPVELPSCGSVFKNPRSAGKHAWQVVDALGLRGHRIGNAQFSPKHSNFIVNLGGALASDVRALIELAHSRANSELGIELETEVKVIR